MKVDVSQIDPPVVSDQAIEIPFSVTITEGGVYKLGTINYPADALVPRAEVEKFLSKYPAGSGRPLDLFLLAVATRITPAAISIAQSCRTPRSTKPRTL